MGYEAMWRTEQNSVSYMPCKRDVPSGIKGLGWGEV